MAPFVCTVSWSQLRKFTECAQSAKLVKTGHKSPTTDTRNFFHGNVLDAAQVEWLNDEGRQPGQMAARVRDLFDEIEAEGKESGDGVPLWRDAGDRGRLANWVIEAAGRLEPLLNELVIPHDFHPALRFRTPLRVSDVEGHPVEVMLIGEIDVLVRMMTDPLEWGVYDLKATRDDTYWRKVRGQLIFYGLAMRAMYELEEWPKHTALIQPMILDEPVKRFEFDDSDYEYMVGQIEAYTHGWIRDHHPMEAKTFAKPVASRPFVKGEYKARPVAPSTCDYCDVRHACPKFDPKTLLGL